MAIDDLLDEHEQSERVRSWLRSNGAGILGGILLGLAVIGGWQWWQKQQHRQRAQAGERYQAALEALEGGDPAKARPQFAALKGTPYEALAALALAKAQVEAGQRDAAIATLRAARADAGSLEAVLVQRLARLLIDAGKPQEALALLAGADSRGALEIRGDAELAAGRREAARASYRKALASAPEGSPQRRLLELKLSDVGGAAAAATPASAASPVSPATPEAKS